MGVDEAIDLLRRALEVEYRFMFHYPRIAGMMPDQDTTQKVRLLGEASVRHAETVSRAIVSLGGGTTIPTMDTLPDPLDLKALFRTQLEYEKLARWLYNEAAGLGPPELADDFRGVAKEEEEHISTTEAIVDHLDKIAD